MVSIAIQKKITNFILLMLNPMVQIAGWVVPVKSNLWVFPVCYLNGRLFDNSKMVFEEAIKDPSRRCVILSRKKYAGDFGIGNEVISLISLHGLWILLRAEVIFVRHGLADIVWPGVREGKRKIINLWHGIPIKGIRYTSIDQSDEKWLEKESKNYSAIIASSKIDRLAMSSSFLVPFKNVWNIGLPRNDILTDDLECLPADYQELDSELKQLLNNRNLILYAPTFRSGGDPSKSPMTQLDLDVINQIMEKIGAVFAIRCHIRDKFEFRMLENYKNIINLSSDVVVETQIVLRNTKYLITDYSSIWIDFLLTKRPVIGFCYDLDEYESYERGTIYNYLDIFPGRVCANFNELSDLLLNGLSSINSESYQRSYEMFFDERNFRSSEAVVNCVNQLIGSEVTD